MGWWSGTKEKWEKRPLLTKGQEGMQNAEMANQAAMTAPGGGYSQAMNYNQNLLQGGQENYDKWASPYMTQFNEQVVPRLSERFAREGGGMGGGATSSSGFAQTLGGAGAQYGSNLAEIYSGLQNKAAGDLMGQYNTSQNRLMNQNNFEEYFRPATPGMRGELVGGLAKNAMQTLFGPAGGGMQGGGGGMEGGGAMEILKSILPMLGAFI